MDYNRMLDSLESRIGGAFSYFENKFLLTMALLFLSYFSIGLFIAPYHIPLAKDSLIYLAKSLAITKGDFSPLLTHFSGWPYFMAPFFYFFKSGSLSQNMIYARIITIFTGACAIFPLAYLGRKLLDKRSFILLLVLFAFSGRLITNSCIPLTEPLFILLLLITVCFILESMRNQNFILAASLSGALAYYVRPQGIFMLPVLLVSFLLLRKEIPGFRHRYLIYIVLIFFIAAAPFLYQRSVYFGSAFFYGANSKYFVNSHSQIWDKSVAIPSLMDYLRTHTFRDYIDKFIIYGFIKLIYNYVCLISPLLLFFFLYGVIRYLNDKRVAPFIVLLSAWIIGHAPVWHVLGGSWRYLNPTLPYVFLFSVLGISDILKNHKHKNILFALFISVFLLFLTILPVKNFISKNKAQAAAAARAIAPFQTESLTTDVF